MTFQPHGLIKTPLQQALYNRAHIANIKTELANPKENETAALLEAILNQNIFNNNNYLVNSQQPPNPNSRNTCDIVVRYLDSESKTVKVLCFAECKRTNTSQAFSLRGLETQALGYCKEYLDYWTSINFVYAVTSAGAHVRLWKYEHDSGSLTPFWGDSKLGQWGEYKDLGDNAAQLEACFGQMKEFPPTAHAGPKLR